MKLMEKLKTISSRIKEEQLSLLGIESMKTISEKTGDLKLVIKYKDGTEKIYDGFKAILKAMEEIKVSSEKNLKENAEQIKKEFFENQEKMKKSIIDNLSDFSLDQIELLQSNLKTIEQKIKEVQKEKVKVKTITISEDIHNKVKKHCVENDLKLSDFVEEVLKNSIVAPIVEDVK